MGEAAAKWLRVSTKGQDEASQDPDLIRWCEQYDYEVKAEYVIHGRSAYHGKHQKSLDEMFADMGRGLFTVLVVWKQDRIERRGMEAALNLVSRAKHAGGRIEFVTQPHLNKLNDMGGRISYAIMAEVANAESQTKSDRVKAKHRNLKDKGSYVGRPPWGYEIVKLDDGRKTLAPTEEGREWIPTIFRMSTEGQSRLDIARHLISAGLKTMNGNTAWSPQGISVLITNPAYMGTPRNSGTLEIEALVSPTEWQAANYSLENRSTWKGRSTAKYEKALLKPLCGKCMSPMYRVPLRVFYYRCHSKGTGKSCGAPMVPCRELDDMVMEMFSLDSSPHTEAVFIPGDDNANAIAKLNEQAAAAIRQANYIRATELMTEAQKLENAPKQQPRTEQQPTGKTKAEHFASLTLDEKRDYLTRYVIVAARPNGRLEWKIWSREYWKDAIPTAPSV
jgi:DNA invertase Pin-like site-specific DNA recombinase